MRTANENELLFRGFLAGLLSRKIREEGRKIWWIAKEMDIKENTLCQKLRRGSFSLYEILQIMHITGITLEELEEYFK